MFSEQIVHAVMIIWTPFIRPDVEEVLHLDQAAKAQQPQDSIKVYFGCSEPGQRV